jgi:raffinose/stachyose/melibiose transport system permease protein
MRKGENGFSILFLSPALIIYLIFVIIPIFLAAYYTLLDWAGAGVPNFYGLGNYIRMVDDADYWKTVRNSFTLVLLAILIQNPVGIGLAYLTSKATVFKRFFRASIFMPVVISATATGLMFSLLLNTDIGIFNRLLDAVGLGVFKRSWLSDPKVVLYSVAVPQVWQYQGLVYFNSVFLAVKIQLSLF